MVANGRCRSDVRCVSSPQGRPAVATEGTRTLVATLLASVHLSLLDLGSKELDTFCALTHLVYSWFHMAGMILCADAQADPSCRCNSQGVNQYSIFAVSSTVGSAQTRPFGVWTLAAILVLCFLAILGGAIAITTFLDRHRQAGTERSRQDAQRTAARRV